MVIQLFVEIPDHSASGVAKLLTADGLAEGDDKLRASLRLVETKPERFYTHLGPPECSFSGKYSGYHTPIPSRDSGIDQFQQGGNLLN